MSFRDDSPEMPDGSTFDGTQLLTLVRSGNSPMSRVWDVNLLIQEIEEVVGSEVVDIPTVTKGANNYVSIRLLPSKQRFFHAGIEVEKC